MDYSKKDTLYEQVKKSLCKFKGEQCYGSGSTSGNSNGSSVAIKVEPAYYTQSEHGQGAEHFSPEDAIGEIVEATEEGQRIFASDNQL